MRLAYFFLATHAEVVNDGRFSVLGGDTSVFFGSSVPFIVPEFHILAKFYFSSAEREISFPIHFEIRDPNGIPIPMTVYDSTCTPVKSDYDELPDHSGIGFAYQNFTFEHFGVYEAQLRLADNLIFSLPILAKLK
jgi:hypothetical protein